MVLAAPRIQTPVVTWEKLPDDFILPDDPVENIQQPFLAAALTEALGTANLIQPEMLVVSNFGLVAHINGKTVVKAPDWLYVPNVSPVGRNIIRRSYTQKTEGEKVAVVMEFLSDTDNGEYSIRPTYPYGKLYFYEQILQVPVYVVFDPYEVTLEVHLLENGRYISQTPSESGLFWIPELQLFLGIWQGTRLGLNIYWLRWWDEAGNLLLWGSEKAEQERQQAEQERQRAEQEHQRAEQERQRADDAIALLELERQRQADLIVKLRELGIDPD